MDKYLTKFEIARVIGMRATDISNGAPPTIDTTGMTDAIRIARAELINRTIPMTIERKYPNGEVKVYKVSEMKWFDV